MTRHIYGLAVALLAVALLALTVAPAAAQDAITDVGTSSASAASGRSPADVADTNTSAAAQIAFTGTTSRWTFRPATVLVGNGAWVDADSFERSRPPTQDAMPAPLEGEHGAVFVSYGIAAGGGASLDHLQFDVDVSLPGTTVSIAGHFSHAPDPNDPTGGGAAVHAGPRAAYDVGPFTLFGEHLFLTASRDRAAASAIGNKSGAGIEIPLRDGAVLRLGVRTHSGMPGAGVDEVVVGFGARF